MKPRRLVYRLLDHRHPALASRLVDRSIMVLILLNVVAVILESVPEWYRRWGPWFDGFEVVSAHLFALEYLMRVWACVENPHFHSAVRGRLRYMLTPMAVVDLAAFLPSMLYLFGLVEMDARLLRILRLARMAKLTRYSDSLDLLFTVIRREAAAFVSSILVLVFLIILAASGIYVVEHEAQPEVFGTIPKSIWWATVTLTTVGYGDVVPVTALGKAFGVLITIAGVGMAAMPAGILASGISSELRKRRDTYRLKLRHALADGVLTEAEYEALRSTSKALGLEEDEAKLLLAEEKVMAGGRRRRSTCPHCGGVLE